MSVDVDQLWEYSYDLDGKEFCVSFLDFMKGRVGFEFIVQLVLIKSLKPLKHSLTAIISLN